MTIYQGRTSRLKASFINAEFLPDPTKSVLTSVQVSYPQSSNTPLRQVGQRALGGNYSFLEGLVNVDFTWLTEYTEAERVFLRYIRHFQEKTGGIALKPTLAANAFVHIDNVGFRTSGINPSQFNMSMTFMNALDMFSTEFDPLEFFGVTSEEGESVLNITEDLNSTHLITEENYSISMRADTQFALQGYRDIKFGEAILSESITSLDSSYQPTWKYDAYVYSDTAVVQHSRGSSESAPRTYSTSRQATMIPTGNNEVTIGW